MRVVRAMLPCLRRLALGSATGVHPAVKRRHLEVEGVREGVLGNSDLVTAVLAAIKVEDYREACRMAKDWCAVSSGHRSACQSADESWEILNERYFSHSPINGTNAKGIVDFFQNCERAAAYASTEEYAPELQVEDALCATFVLARLRVAPAFEYKRVHHSLREDRTFVLKAMQANGMCLQYADVHYTNSNAYNFASDREVVLAAVRSKGWAFRHADPKFRTDREIVLAAAESDGAILKLLPRQSPFLADAEIALAAVKSSEEAMGFVSPSLINNYDVALAAVTDYGWVLRYVGHQMRANRDVVLAAVKSWGDSLRYASGELKEDREVVLAAVSNDGAALRHAATLSMDREVVMEAVGLDPRVLEFASPDLQDDFDVVMAAVTGEDAQGVALKYASERLRSNREIVLAAVRQSTMAHSYALLPGSDDPEVIEELRYGFIGRPR